MKLYEVPNKTWVRIAEPVRVPYRLPPLSANDLLFFDHLDGMYSYCLDLHSNVVHPAAWTEVEIVPSPKDHMPA